MFGEAAALGGDAGNPMAVAQTEVSAILIPTEKVRELLTTSPSFASFMANSLVHKLTASTIQLGAIAGKRVMSRLASALLMLDFYGVPRDETGVWYLVTHAELAGLIDTRGPMRRRCCAGSTSRRSSRSGATVSASSTRKG
jgi:CRP-like cAMP-binding protein